MNGTVMDRAFRVMMLKMGYTESDMRVAFLVLFRGNHDRVR